MKAVLHESGSTHYHKSKAPSDARLNKLMKKKLEKKAKKMKNAKNYSLAKNGKHDGNTHKMEQK